MNVIPTDLNRRLSEWLQNRVTADRSVIAGRVHFWRLIGLGLILFGIGMATGIGFFGYSYIARNSDNLSTLSTTFSKALAEVQLRAMAQGTIEVEPQEISLAKDQTISLDRNSRLLLDPAAKVLVDGDIRVQAPPTISVPQAMPQRSGSRTPTITNFTVFKTVRFDKGMVVTGWNFLTSSQKAPTEEYCYYTQNAETPGVNVDLRLGSNRKPESPQSVPNNFDIAAAFNRCVWFRS
jgi:hypothetical protein